MKTTLKYFRTVLFTGIVALALGMPAAYAEAPKANPCNPEAMKQMNPCNPDAKKKMKKGKMKKSSKKGAVNPCAPQNPCAPKAANPDGKK